MAESNKSFAGMSLHVQIRVAPEDAEKWLSIAKPVFERTHQYPECTYFELYIDPNQPGLFKWIENWNVDIEWLMKNHFSQDFMREYLETTEPMFIEPRKAEVFARLGDRSWTYVSEENSKAFVQL